MARIQLIDGRIIENAQITDIKRVGEEGSRSATAHIDGRAYHVYNSIVDGASDVWIEQIEYTTYATLGKGGFVEGSLSEGEKCEVCQELNGPFIHVEASHDGEVYQWLAVCSEDCLYQVTLRWKQIAEIERPNQN